MPNTNVTNRVFKRLPSRNTYWTVNPASTPKYLRTDSRLSLEVEVGYTQRIIVSTNGDYKKPTLHSYRVDRVEHPLTETTRYEIDGEGSWGIARGALCNANDYGFPSYPYNTALERFYGELRGSVDLSVAVAEMGQTSRMLRSALRLSKFIKALSPRQWANSWLEYQYGWKPLVSDIYDASLQSINSSKRCFRTKIKGRAVEKDDRVYFNKTSSGLGTNRVKRSSRVEIAASFRLNDTSLSQLANFTSLNPVSIAWELLPYSFVVDWVYDVGSYLRNTESALLYRTMFDSGYVHRGFFMENIGESRSSFSDGQGNGQYGTGRSLRIIKNKLREPLISIPFPHLPRFQADLGSQRLLSAASLLYQHLGVANGRRLFT